MRHKSIFVNGRHLAAARVMAGLKQTELAKLAGLHVNSLKRLERMGEIADSRHSCERLAFALAALGIAVTREPATVVCGKSR